jgi:hypothetical protein
MNLFVWSYKCSQFILGVLIHIFFANINPEWFLWWFKTSNLGLQLPDFMFNVLGMFGSMF